MKAPFKYTVLLNLCLLSCLAMGGDFLSNLDTAANPAPTQTATVDGVNITVQQQIIIPENLMQLNSESMSSKRFLNDNMENLIRKQQQQLGNIQSLAIKEQRSIRAQDQLPSPTYQVYNEMDYDKWLSSAPSRAQEVLRYHQYLGSRVGLQNVPPMQQLLTTARDWQQCGYEPYEVPPMRYWGNMVDTLRLYARLKQQHILPPSTTIRSAYRSPSLNACAGGAASSKHVINAAIDIWIPEYDEKPWLVSKLHENLCTFWLYQGDSYQFGLGLYPTSAIHIDTLGHRKWGASNTSTSSICRISMENP